MKLIDELRTVKGFTAGLILTYDVTLDWFERLLGRQLALLGVRRLAILADGRCLSETIANQLPLLHGAGRHYVVQGITMPRGRFHPKLVLLSGPAGARLYVGSGNLSASGFGRNLEIFERWDAAPTDPTVPRAFDDVRRFLDKILEQRVGRHIPADLQDVLDKVFGAETLVRKAVDESGPELLGSPGALFERLPAPPSPATTLHLMAPYFDADGELVTALAKKFGALDFEVVTDPLRSNLSRRATARIRDCGGTIVALEDERSLHAKVLYAVGPGWEIAATGSANLSRAAWRGYNAELIVLRRGSDATIVGRLLEELEQREITDEEWEALWARVEAETEKEESLDDEPAVPDGIAARWVDRNRVQVTVRGAASSVTGAEWLERGELRTAFAQLVVGAADIVEVTRPDDVERGAGVVALRLVEGAVAGCWIVVHDPAELREAARAPSRGEQKLGELLAAGDDDLDAAERLVEFLGRMWRERRQEEALLNPAQEGDEESEKTDETGPTRLVRLAEGDFVEPRTVRQEPTGRPTSRVPITLPIRLMQRLLFGDLDGAEADADEGESGEIDDQDDEDVVAPTSSERRVDPARCARFLHAATMARDAYLEQLRTHDDEVPPLGRLFEDLQVLAATLHYGARAGALLPGHFVRAMVPVLRAFLGRKTAALPRALSAVTLEDRHDIWSRGEPLLLVALLLYNTWLAAYDATPDRGESGQPTLFGMSLWMRHVVRQVPEDELARVRGELSRRVPQLRSGILWIADRWPDVAGRLSFSRFVEQLLSDAQALLVVEHALGNRLADLSATPGVRELLEDETLVVGTGRDGCLALGFVEIDESPRLRRSASAFLRDGAFMAAARYGDASHLESMVQVPARTLVPVDLIDTLLDDARPELRRATEVLKRIAEE